MPSLKETSSLRKVENWIHPTFQSLLVCLPKIPKDIWRPSGLEWKPGLPSFSSLNSPKSPQGTSLVRSIQVTWISSQYSPILEKDGGRILSKGHPILSYQPFLWSLRRDRVSTNIIRIGNLSINGKHTWCWRRLVRAWRAFLLHLPNLPLADDYHKARSWVVLKLPGWNQKGNPAVLWSLLWPLKPFPFLVTLATEAKPVKDFVSMDMTLC